MEYVCHTITLNLLDEKYSFALKAKRGDTAVKLKIYLKENVYPYTIGKDCYAVLIGTKMDGTILYNHCDIEDNAVVYTFTEQTVSAFGPVACAVKLYGPDHALITSTTFRIDVEGVMYAEHVVESKDEVSALTHLVSDTNAMLQEGRSYVSQSKEVLENAQLAVKDAQAALEDASRATEAASTAADRANAASDIAYEANEKVDTLREVVSKFHSNIVEETSGELVTLADASNLELVGLKVFGRTEQRTTTGKNLLPKAANTLEVDGVAFTVNADGSVTVNGTPDGTANCYFYISVALEVGKQYAMNGCPKNGSSTTYYTMIQCIKDGVVTFPADETGSGKTFTVQEGMSGFAYVICIRNGYTANNLTFHPMIRLASITDDTYEPYTGGIPSPNPDYPQALESVGDGGSVTVTAEGKNLLKTPTIGWTVNGITITVNSDGSITANGTAKDTAGNPVDAAFGIGTITPMENLILTGCPSGGSANTYYIVAGGIGFDYGSGLSIPAIAEMRYITLVIAAGNTVSNLTFYPMIRLASITDDTYEPYAATTATVTPVDSSGNALHLPGIPVTSGGNYTNETGQQWICDYVDLGRGVYVQNIKFRRMLSTDGWNKYTSRENMFFNSVYEDIKPVITIGNNIFTAYLCTHLIDGFDKVANTPNTINLYYSMEHSSYRCFINVEGITTVDELKAYLDANEVYIAYAITTPIEHKLTAEELAQYAALHTNYPNTTLYNDAGAHMEVKYVADTKLYVDKKFAELAAALVSTT